MKSEIRVHLQAKGMLWVARKPPEAGRETWNISSLTASERTQPPDTLTSDFQSPEWGDNKFLLFKQLTVQYFVVDTLGN